MILPHIPASIVRLRISPDEPTVQDCPESSRARAFGARPGGSRQPHADATVTAVRRLIEQTTLSQQQIADKTGVKRATISVWQKNYGWKRPPLAPRAPDSVPLWRAGPGLKLRLLTARLLSIAERMVRELEKTADTDLETLVQALQVVKMARTTAIGNRRRPLIIGKPRTGQETMTRDDSIRAAIREMHRHGVEIDRAPQEAVDLVIEANTPVEPDHPALKPRKPGRGRRTLAYRQHLNMLEKE